MNLSQTTALCSSRMTSLVSSSPCTASLSSRPLSLSAANLSLVLPRTRASSPLSVSARKSRSDSSEPPPPTILGTTAVEEAALADGEEDLVFDELEDDEEFIDDDFDIAEYEDDEETETHVGDGAAGGGISLAGTWWDQKALEIAQQVSLSFKGTLDIYAFKTFQHSAIRVRVENISLKSGSPSMDDIQAFAKAYRARLDEAELTKAVPDNIILEVSSPGVERIVRIPQDLNRFKERTMYVKYSNQVDNEDCDGIFTLVSFDTETKQCTWALANVRANREKAGKGRPLNKKQREWRLDTPFESLRLVRLYPSDC